MDNPEEISAFEQTIELLKQKYKRRNIEWKLGSYGKCVFVDGESRFTTTGHNLLYCLTRLCDVLKDELL